MIRDSTTLKLYSSHTADISLSTQTIKKVTTKVHYGVVHTLGYTCDLRCRMVWALCSTTHEGVGHDLSL
jgi:hypothetical protein